MYRLIFEQKSGRVYKIGTRFIELPTTIFRKFLEWSDECHKSDIECDKRLVSALMLSIYDDQQIRKGDAEKEVVEFIQGEFGLLNTSLNLSMSLFFFSANEKPMRRRTRPY